MLNQVLKNTPHVMINMWLAILQKDYRDLMGQIQVPCLYTYGRRKSMCSPEIADWLKVRIPDCSTAGFDGGHIQFLQDAENFNQVVFEFLGK